MLIVQSFWPGVKHKDNIDKVIKHATLSHKFIRKHNFRSLLYTHKDLAFKFEHIPYDEVRDFDEKDFKDIYKPFWSAGKLIAASKVNEPFYHVDFDLFMFKDKILEIEKEPFMCLHSEPWLNPKFYETDQEFLEEHFPFLANDERVHSYNFGIFGGQDFLAITETFTEILEFSKTHHKALKEVSEIYNAKYKKLNGSNIDWDTAVRLEQVLSSSLIRFKIQLEEVPTWIPKQNIKNIPHVYEEFKKLGIFHLWCNVVKKNFELAFGEDLFLKMLESYYLYDKQ